MGGTAGLFLGASILSIVELPYFLIIRGFRKVLNKENAPAQAKVGNKEKAKLSSGSKSSGSNRLMSIKGKFGVKKILRIIAKSVGKINDSTCTFDFSMYEAMKYSIKICTKHCEFFMTNPTIITAFIIAIISIQTFSHSTHESCKMFKTTKAIIKDYLLNSSIHGFRFIADDNLHLTERLFWLICVMLSWYASSLLILASWDAFQNNAISFVMETTYTDWNTDFPAIAICETDNVDRVYVVSDDIWTTQHEVELEEVLKELAYFRGLTFYTLQYCNKEDADPLCPHNNFSFYANLVRSTCESSVANCKYNNKPFDCCSYFHEIDTDIGRCYIMNSVQHKKMKNSNKRYPMVNNKNSKLGLMSMEVLIPSTVYTIGEEEVPTLTSLQSDFFAVAENVQYRRHIAVRNIVNDPNTRETTPKQRNCRFRDENNLDVYPYYSYSACTVQCRKNNQKKICNCTDHFMPNTDEKDKCNLEGLVCLNLNYATLSVMRPEWAKRSGLVCDCPPSCTETDITIIKDDKKSYDGTYSYVEIELEFLPTERYTRNVVRSRLDLVVSCGGTAGLFVGASLLSFVELIYYLGIRYYGTLYMKKKENEIKIAEKERKKNSPLIKFISEKRNVAFVDIKRTRSSLHK